MLKRLYFNKLRKFNFLLLKNLKTRHNFLKDFFNIFQSYNFLSFPQIFNSFNTRELNMFFGSSGVTYYITKFSYNFYLDNKKKFIVIGGKNFCKFLFFFKLFNENYILNLNKKKKMPFLNVNFVNNKISLKFFIKILKYIKFWKLDKFNIEFFIFINIKLISRLFFMKFFHLNFFKSIVNSSSVGIKKKR